METNERTARAIGVLLLASILFGVLNSVPALEYPDYLTTLATMRTRVLVAVAFQAAMALAYVWVTVLTYPLVARHARGLARGYFGLRMIGAGFLFVGIGSLLLLLWLSEHAATVSHTDLALVQMTGELLRRGRDILNHIGMILPWSVGGLLLYYSLYQTLLVPRWLSVWGLLASSLTLLSTILLMLDAIEMATPTYFIMNAPMALLEVSLAVFLLFWGFCADAPARASPPAQA